MSTTTIHAQLQTLNLALTQISTAPIELPGSINNADLPMALSYPEGAEHRTHSVKVTAPVRDWVIRVYVRPLGKGQVDEGFAEVMPVLDALVDEYEELANQKQGTYWDDLELVRDDGIDILTLHDAQPAQGTSLPRYWGTRIYLQITPWAEES